MSARPKLTRFQRECLEALRRRGAPSYNPGGWWHTYLLGGRGVWMRLQEKGYVDLENRPGPRGGENIYVRIRTI